MGGPANLPRLAALAWTGPLVGWAGPAMWVYTQRKKAVEAFTAGDGLQLKGSEADKKAYMEMVRREMLRSKTFYALMVAIKADKKHPVEVLVGRNMKNVTIDSFDSKAHQAGAQTIDLAEIEVLPVDPPSSHPHAPTRGELLVHAMAEAREGADGQEYDPAHEAGIKAQNDYRDERGQKGHRFAPSKDPEPGPPRSGNGEWVMFYDNGYRERWEMKNHKLTKINRYD